MKNIGVFYGGYTGESLISEKSSQTIINAIKDDYQVFPIYINKDKWLCNGKSIDLNTLRVSDESGDRVQIDYVFNMIHGTPGEDGKIAAYLDLLGIPYSSADHLSAAMTMNKVVCNRFLERHGFRVAKSIVLNERKDSYDISDLKYPVFVKPLSGGSSIATSKVKTASDLTKAVDMAFIEEDQVMVEEFIDGRELTCGVVKYEGVVQSLAVTEIICKSEFFDYQQKYDADGAEEVTPAKIDEELEQEIRLQAESIFKLFGLKNMARVDFIKEKGELFVLEVNTIPGFSPKSILPQQLKVKGIPLGQFVKSMIE